MCVSHLKHSHGKGSYHKFWTTKLVLLVLEAIYQLLTSEEKAKGIAACFLFQNQIRINAAKLKHQI